MSEEAVEKVEFVPTDLGQALGDDSPSTPEVVEPEPEAEKVEETKEPEAETKEGEAKPEPEDQASNFAELRSIVKELKQENTDLKSKPQEPEKVPDVFEDQEAYTAHLNKTFDSKMLNMSVEMAKEQFNDYDDMEARFIKEAETNPAILGNINGKANQALAVYREGKKLMELDKIGDPVQYRATLKAEIIAELKADSEKTTETKATEKEALTKSLPDDLTSETSAGNRKPAEAPSHTSLDALFP